MTMVDMKIAIVTGSTSGIGLAVARSLAGAGHAVMLNGLGDPGEVEKLRSEIETSSGSPIAYNNADMSRPDQISALVEATIARFGRVDIVVNNAGIQTVSPIEDFPVDRYELIMAINMSSAWHMTRLTMAAMKQRKWGRYINIASAHALVASPFKSAYVMSKHAVLGLTKTVALEGAEFGITANAICPGYVLTPLVEKQIPETAKARGITEEEVVRDVLLAAQPTKQFVGADQIGALATFLCSPAASQITGTALPVDGGWTAQ
jgi:3-hydroxybutyrate dehydrogenase